MELLDPSIQYSMDVIMLLRGRLLHNYTYERPFDQHRIAYLLDILLQLVKFGGQSFSRIASTTFISRSSCPEFVKRIEESKLLPMPALHIVPRYSYFDSRIPAFEHNVYQCLDRYPTSVRYACKMVDNTSANE